MSKPDTKFLGTAPGWRGSDSLNESLPDNLIRDFDIRNSVSIGLRLSLSGCGLTDNSVQATPTAIGGDERNLQSGSQTAVGQIPKPEIPGYEILCELGRGGMGVVYQARQVRLNRVVALKMILAGEHASREAIQRLLGEAEAISRLNHPNIVQIHATGDWAGQPYVELEFVAGGSLASRLDGTPWPPRPAARIIERVARAAAEAHRMGIVHRDLKPANILMTTEGEPKISDFGLAKTTEEDCRLTRTQAILGSPSYMAPEQADGQARAAGPEADTYALGATLYELLTGRPPFVALTPLATLDLVRHSEPVPPRRLRRRLPLDLDTICLKCLEKAPHQRYRSADALADDLEAFLNYEPIRARRPPPWERSLKWLRHRPAVAALFLVTALAALSSIGIWRRHALEVACRAEAIRRHDNALREQIDQFLNLARAAIDGEDWEGAKTHLSSARALIRSEPRLTEMRATVDNLLALSELRILTQKRREQARARLAKFQHLWDEALFCASDFTGMAPETKLRSGRAAARAALEQFGLRTGRAVKLNLDPTHYSAQQSAWIVDSCYVLTLLLAEAESQPLAGESREHQLQKALRALDLAKTLRAPSLAYHVRRAGYLKRLGDHSGASAEERLAAKDSLAAGSSIDEFLAGEHAYRRGDLKAASTALRRTLLLEPDHFWALYLLAVCHLKAHQPSEAQAALVACQSRRPRFVWTYLLRGFAEAEMREFDLGEADFRHALELGVNVEERYVLLVNRGVLRVRRGAVAEAIDDLSAAIALRPGQFQAYVNLSQAYQALGKPDQALASLAQAIDRAPSQPVLYRARSELERSMSRQEAALSDLARAIELAPFGDPAVANDYISRAAIFQQAGRFEEALASCDLAIKLAPSRPDAHRLRGIALLGLKRYNEAIRALDLSLSHGAAPPGIYEIRGLAHSWAGAHERAISDYTMALNKGQCSPSLYANEAGRICSAAPRHPPSATSTELSASTPRTPMR